MYEDHLRYLENVAAYDAGGGSTSYAVHKAWVDSMTCPVLTLDGAEDLEKTHRSSQRLTEKPRKTNKNIAALVQTTGAVSFVRKMCYSIL